MERHWRIRLYERLRAEGCSEALALEAAGTPRSTLFLWRRALRQHGLAGLADRSRRPARMRRPQWTRRDEAAVWGKPRAQRATTNTLVSTNRGLRHAAIPVSSWPI